MDSKFEELKKELRLRTLGAPGQLTQDAFSFYLSVDVSERERIKLSAYKVRDVEWIISQWQEDMTRWFNHKRFENGEMVRVNEEISRLTGLNPTFIWTVLHCTYPIYEIAILETDMSIRVHEKFLTLVSNDTPIVSS